MNTHTTDFHELASELFDIQEEMQCHSLVLFVTERKYISIFDKLVKFGQSIERQTVKELTHMPPGA